jgi:hypothetical protein
MRDASSAASTIRTSIGVPARSERARHSMSAIIRDKR